jgi:hypothetical protein
MQIGFSVSLHRSSKSGSSDEIVVRRSRLASRTAGVHPDPVEREEPQGQGPSGPPETMSRQGSEWSQSTPQRPDPEFGSHR